MSANHKGKGPFLSAVTGTVLIALCCFTPLLVILLGFIGLSSMTPYLDVVLLPALIIMVILTILSFRKWKQSRSE